MAYLSIMDMLLGEAPASPAAKPAPVPARPKLTVTNDQVDELYQYLRSAAAPYMHGSVPGHGHGPLRDALERGEVALHYAEGGGLDAVALHRVAKVASSNLDFTGAAMMVPAGAAVASLLVGSPHGVTQLLYAHPWTVVHAAQEDKETTACLRAAGYRLWYVKISAGSAVFGVYGKDIAAVDYGRDMATLTYVDGVLQDEDLAAIRAELAEYQMGAEWAQHYSGYNKGGAWTAFGLVGYSKDAHFIEKPSEMSAKWKSDNPPAMQWAGGQHTAAAGQFKRTLDIVRRSLGEYPMDRVRFMRLAPGGGELTRHADITDKDAGTKPGQSMRVHLPIITNPRVQFTGWDLHGDQITAHWPLGGAGYLDRRKPHACVNRGEAYRVHLVIDVDAASPVCKALTEVKGKQNV